MLSVNKYNPINSNIVSYSSYSYNKITLPDNIQLVLDIIDDETENTLISLIKNNKVNELRTISKCITDNVFIPLGLKFNDYQFTITPKGTGIKPYIDNKSKYGGVSAILNMGSDVLFNLKNTTKNTVSNIVLPRRSLLIIIDPNYEILKGVAQRDTDIIDYSTTIVREDRYSITFRSAKY
jgi:hypothetical protein